MRFRLEPSTRLPRVPWWAVAIIAAWAAGVGSIVALSRAAEREVVLCHFRALTGMPCPTCGSTRAALAAMDGRVLDALLYNPLVVVAGGAVIALLAFRAVTGRVLRFEASRAVVRGLWAVGALLFALNWTYVWMAHRNHESSAASSGDPPGAWTWRDDHSETRIEP